MNRDKQIEIARELCPFSQEYESCSKCNTELDIDGEPCIYMIMAKHITDKCYRKASEVAREIFAEVESNIYPMLGLENDKEYVAILSTTFAELKKKYESEGEG